MLSDFQSGSITAAQGIISSFKFRFCFEYLSKYKFLYYQENTNKRQNEDFRNFNRTCDVESNDKFPING